MKHGAVVNVISNTCAYRQSPCGYLCEAERSTFLCNINK